MNEFSFHELMLYIGGISYYLDRCVKDLVLKAVKKGTPYPEIDFRESSRIVLENRKDFFIVYSEEFSDWLVITLSSSIYHVGEGYDCTKCIYIKYDLSYCIVIGNLDGIQLGKYRKIPPL